MKTAIRKVVVMSFLLMGIISKANNVGPKPVMVVRTLNAERFKLFVPQVLKPAFLEIVDQNGEMMHCETMKSGKYFSKVYDMSILPEGLYYLKIDDGNYSSIYTVEKTYDRISVAITYSAPNIDNKTLALLMN